MEFFDSKQEVIEIKLTQFGKNSLARGVFQPVYYQFFDDGILYNMQNASSTETQNESETRILKETPYLKGQYLCSSVETQYDEEEERIISGTMNRFQTLRKNFDPDIQDKILLYPLGEKEVGIQSLPFYYVNSLGASFTTGSVQYLTSSGVEQKISQISVEPLYEIIVDNQPTMEPHMTDPEQFFDPLASKINFLDGTSVSTNAEDFVIDLQELHSFYGLENFEVEIFSVENTNEKKVLKRLSSLESIRQYFDIKTDEDVDLGDRNIKSLAQTNYRKKGEI